MIASRYENRPYLTVGDPPVARTELLRRARYGNLPGKLTLLEVLGACRGLGATDPRDHVYAGLNMVEDPRIGLLKPDYLRSVTEVFVDTVEWFLKAKTSALNVLGYVEERGQSSAEPPLTGAVFSKLAAGMSHMPVISLTTL